MASPELMTGLGAVLALFLSSAGSAVASAQGALYSLRSSGIYCFAPIIIAGVLAVYGIIVAVILSSKIEDGLTEAQGYKYFASGLSVGLACLCSGFSMAKFLEKYMEQQPPQKPTAVAPEQEPLLGLQSSGGPNLDLPPANWKFLNNLVFLEAIGLYGLITALILSYNAK